MTNKYKSLIFFFALLLSIIVNSNPLHASVWLVNSLNDSGIGSLRAAADSCVTGDTIRFSQNLIANGSDSIVLTSGEIVLGNKGIVIKGLYNSSDTLFISGNLNSRIFSFENVGRMILDSLVLMNGFDSISGGAVYVNNPTDTLFVKNSHIMNNKAGEFGGGICIESDSSSTFNALVMESTIIKGNSSNRMGGGIYSSCVFPSVISYVYVKSSYIVENEVYLPLSPSFYSSGMGGGVCSQSEGVNSVSTVKIIDSFITKNTVHSDSMRLHSYLSGGGIASFSYCNTDTSISYQDISSVIVDNSTISGNKVLPYSSYLENSSAIGGGIFCRSYIISEGVNVVGRARVSVNNSNISDNVARSVARLNQSSHGQFLHNNTGGGISCNSLISNQDTLGKAISNIIVKGSTLKGNYVGKVSLSSLTRFARGGALFSDAQSINSNNISLVDLESSTLTENKTTWRGGAIESYSFLDSSIVNILNSTIFNNNADSSGEGVVSVGIESFINTKGSIIAHNGGNQSGFEHLSGSSVVTSSGFNIFSDSVSGVSNLDSLNVSLLDLNLLPLAFNGGTAPTLMPGVGSVAINNGDPSDFTDAQNVPVIGVREIGSAEVCYTTFGTDSVSACSTYTWIDGNTYYTSTKNVTHIIPNASGCDSVISLHLIIINSIVESYDACGPFTWRNGVTYNESNFTARDTILTSGSCDSIFVLNLTIRKDSTVEVITACDSLTWVNGITYYSSVQNIRDTLVNAYGCDSIVTLNLTVTPSINVVDSVSACLFYQWIDGQVYLSDNNSATQTFVGSNGCDSVVTLNLDINYGTLGMDTQVVCDSLVWIDGITYYTDNSTATYTLIGANSHGCDSLVSLDLTVIGSQSIDVVSTCDSLTWINGVTYYSSTNSIKDTLINSLGCDSIISLDLTITNSTTFTDIITSCNPITWIDGNVYASNNNTATYVLVNAAGCDSVVTLDLTVLQSSYSIDVVSACSEFTWIDGVTYYISNNTANYTFVNSQGCDSIVYLDLIIYHVDTSVTRNGLELQANANAANFQWIDCDNGLLVGETNASFTATANGNYQVEITQNGCVDTSDCITVNNVGIGEVSLSNNINIYPNPVHDQVNIEITNWPTNGVEIVVRDIAGKLVYTKEVEPISNKETISINTTKWAKGTYFIELSDGENQVVEKIVVQ